MKDGKTRAKFPEVITFTIDGSSYQSGEHVRFFTFLDFGIYYEV